MAVYTDLAAGLRVAETAVFATYAIPTKALQVTQATEFVVYQRKSNMNVTQAALLAVVRGRIYNPTLRAWTFDLDGHEFYVLNLGTGKTLVYDRATEKIVWWSNDQEDSWRAANGTNWVQSGAIADDYGSNVVAGDDTTGIIWVLDPYLGYDQSADAAERAADIKRPYPREVTGMVLARGREFIACNEVYLVGDFGQPAFTGAEVTLSFSDDQGRSYMSAGTIESVAGEYQQEFAWRSLGLIQAPGRFFRISDDGAFRIVQELSIANG